MNEDMQNDASVDNGNSRIREPVPASWLYVPGNKPDLLEKAMGSDAEALIVDLEDAIPPKDKSSARTNVRRWFMTNGGWHVGAQVDGQEKQIWVRINADAVDEDVTALSGPDGELLCAGIILAKAERRSLAKLSALVKGRAPIIGLVESAAGLRSLDYMAREESVATFGIGEVDLLADLRMQRSSASEAAIDAIRLEVVTVCAAENLGAPIAPTSTNFRDLDSFEAGTHKFQDLGFRARTAIHPAQCGVINEVFTPSETAIAEARSVVERSDGAAGGVALDDAGRLIDAAVVRGARETIQRSMRRRPGTEPPPPRTYPDERRAL